MNIEGIKEQARRHEQKEEWKKALDLYLRAIEGLEAEQRPDVSLHNRVGDLAVRVGELDRATKHYEQAVELYVDAELPNNAIAICKKIIRNVPTRHSVYLMMGRIRAQQGFLTDARQCFLTFAERAQASGKTDEALLALEELADLSPENVEIRATLARALQQHGRSEEAVTQLRAAHRVLSERGDSAGAEAIHAKAMEIDPSADFTSADRGRADGAAPDGLHEMAFELGASVEATAGDDSFMEIATDDFELGSSADEGEEEEGGSAADEEAGASWPAFSIGDPDEPAAEAAGRSSRDAEPPPEGFDEAEAQEAAAAFSLGAGDEPGSPSPDASDESPLPLLEWSQGSSIDLPEDDTYAVDPLPLLNEPDSAGPELEGVGARAALDLELGVDVAAQDTGGSRGRMPDRPRPPSTGSPEGLIAAGDLTAAERLIRERMAQEPREIALAQRLVEVAYRRGDPHAQADAYVELARRLELVGSPQQAQSVYQQVVLLEPDNAVARSALAAADAAAPEVAQVASSEDYVDLASLIFGDEDEPKTTRFLVAYEEPSGDEQADFTRMLTQFKAKIAENVGADDVRSHYDLGTAYKEMGLIDEAIEEFQAALRASRDHLPTYELLGHCFLAKGQPEAAVKSLERAMALSIDVEDELLGIYYYLGRAYEQTGNRAAAVEYYDRVFSLDINFMDVTERLRALR